MITAEKPELNEDLLMHFGVRGMKWGKHKAKAPTSTGSKKSPAKKQGMSTGKKVAIGVALVGGAATAAYILSKRGKIPAVSVGKWDAKPSAYSRIQKLRETQLSTFKSESSTFRKTMLADSKTGLFTKNPGDKNLLKSVGKNSAKIRKATSGIDDASQRLLLGNQEALTRALNTPGFTWNL